MFYNQYISSWGPGAWWPFGFGAFGTLLLVVIGLWFLAVIALKGYALWNAAKRGQKWWFIALLIINTVGILELVYIFFVLKRSQAKTGQTPQA